MTIKYVICFSVFQSVSDSFTALMILRLTHWLILIFFLSQIAEKIYDELETPTECRKNFKKCKLCGGTELMNEKLVVSDTASAGGGANGVGTGGGATSMSSPATSSVIFRSISFRREYCTNCSGAMHVIN